MVSPLLSNNEGRVYKCAEHFYPVEFAYHYNRPDQVKDNIHEQQGYALKEDIHNIKLNDTWYKTNVR